MIYTYPDGVQVDLNTGEVVGQAPPREVTPAQARRPETADIQPTGPVQGAWNALQQLSFGFNSALFALPDAIIKEVGQVMGVPEKELPQFVNYFNRGQQAPKNATERYARSIGQGAGAVVPYSGVLGYVAKTKALTGPLKPNASITKRVAKETLDFIRENPRLAVSMDLAFGGAYGAVEQAVEETTQPGEMQDVLKATVPLAATVGVPLVGNKIFGAAQKLWSISPTANVLKAVTGRSAATPEAPIPPAAGEISPNVVRQAVAATVPKIPGLRGPFGMAGNWYGSKAQKGISERLKETLSKEVSPDVEEQIRITREIENIARQAGMEDIQFVFSLPEATLNAPLLEAYRNVVKNASPEILADIRRRLAANDQAFLTYAQRLTPDSPMSFDEALALHAAERTRVMDNALKNVADITDAEKLRIMDSINAETNLADIGQSLRAGIIAQREGVFNRFRMLADEISARPFGVRRPVREEATEIAEGVPSVSFKSFGPGFLNKYKLDIDNRWFSGEVPPPARELQRVLGRVKEAQQEALPNALNQLVREELSKTNKIFNNLRPEEQDAMARITVEGIIGGKLNTKKDLDMLKRAEELAAKQMEVNITLPEAVDFLQSAQRYRNYMFLKSNQDLEYGLPRAFADQVKRNGEELLSDVEKFVFQSFKDVPRIKEFEELYRNTYTQGYDKLFPLLATKKRPTGEYMWGDEQVVRKALESRENLRSLNAIFGEDPTYARFLNSAMLSRAREANVIKDGVLNPEAYSRFLSRNKSLIDDLPETVQASLRDELRMGQSFAEEVAKRKAYAESLQDLELDRLIRNAIRPDAESGPLIRAALNDPASMRKIVDTVGKDPARLEAVRAQVWKDVVSDLTNPADPLLIKDFLIRHGKSLNILYDKEHLDNLRLLGDIQQRVLAAARPSGVVSPFKTFDEKLREKIGAGIGTVESTARAATIQKISPQHAAVSLLSRLVSRQQQSITDKILLSALTDPAYARQLVNATSSLDSPKGFKEMSNLTFKAGAFLPTLIRNAPKAATIEAIQALESEELLPLGPRAVVPQAFRPAEPPRPTAQQLPMRPVGPRNLGEASMQVYGAARRPPAAPASSAVTPSAQPRRPVPRMPSAPQTGAPAVAPSPTPPGDTSQYETYRMLFPNDPISPMLQRPQ